MIDGFHFMVDVFGHYLVPQYSVQFYIYCLRNIVCFVLNCSVQFVDLLLEYFKIIITKCPSMSLYDLCINIISLNVLEIFIIFLTNIGCICLLPFIHCLHIMIKYTSSFNNLLIYANIFTLHIANLYCFLILYTNYFINWLGYESPLTLLYELLFALIPTDMFCG